MSRLIDADVLKESVIRWLPQDPCGIAEKERPFETDICVSMLMEIEEAPTVDAVEVIRCEKCKWWNIDGMPIADKHFCYELRDYVKPDFYCRFAERRQDG